MHPKFEIPFDSSPIPSGLRGGLERYFNDRLETGGFLRAVLENDLMGAVRRADAVSFAALPLILGFLLEHAPANAWGSKAAVAAWLAPMTREEEAAEAGRRG